MRRPLLAAVFVLVVLCVVVLLHGYLVQRLVVDPGLGGWARLAALGVILGLAGLLVALPAAERLMSRRRGRWLAWPASLWMGFAFLLVTLFATADVARWLLGGVAGAAVAPETTSGAGAGATRALTVLALAGGLGLWALREGLGAPRVRRSELVLARWPRALDGLRIVQLSDIHIGPLLGRGFAEHLVERVNALGADLVAVTGDLVDGSVAQLGDDVAPFAGLRSVHGTFFVSGNHDHYSGAEAWETRVSELGMRVLRNECVTLQVGDAAFDLAGVDDHHAHYVSPGRSSDVAQALQDRDPARPVVLLAHDPSTFKEASRHDVDLQLSGHTHGGQIWPFAGLVRLAVPFLAGLYERGDARLYVSRGTGFWGPPMRLLAPSEITELVLRAPVEAGAESEDGVGPGEAAA